MVNGWWLMGVQIDDPSLNPGYPHKRDSMLKLRDGDVEGRGVLRLEHRRRPEHLRHLLPQVSPDPCWLLPYLSPSSSWCWFSNHCFECFPMLTTMVSRNFSSTETLCSDNKFKCDTCSSYQVFITIHTSYIIFVSFQLYHHLDVALPTRRLTRGWELRSFRQSLHFTSSALSTSSSIIGT